MLNFVCASGVHETGKFTSPSAAAVVVVLLRHNGAHAKNPGEGASDSESSRFHDQPPLLGSGIVKANDLQVEAGPGLPASISYL